jgi:cytochrome oxidase Cu insertion factor (SCO1/SenC/PrrC family)
MGMVSMRVPLARLLTLAVLLAVCLTGCSSYLPALVADDDYGTVGDFSLTERDGRIIQRTDLARKTWVAAFIFTRCAGPCAQISQSMAHLQQDFAGAKDVALVSFTVDPEYDTPEVLSTYAARYEADPECWLFLTGNRDTIYELIRKRFHLGVEQNEGPERRSGNEVEHSVKLVLVDGQGHIRGYFDGTDSALLAELRHRMLILIWQNR